MRKKRLKHTSFIICHMFCGWRLINSYNVIEKYGTGTLNYDLLSNECRFNNNTIEKMNIFFEIDAFFNKELKRMGIEKNEITKAILNVKIEIEKIDHKKRITNDFHLDKNEKPINKGAFNKCKIDTECIIATDESEYIGKYNDIEEWPEKWLRKE